MQLKEIYHPIEREMSEVKLVLRVSLMGSRSKSILKIGEYLLDVKGKMLRPAMVILSAKAATGKPLGRVIDKQIIKVAAAIELIHRSSLIHDDVIDHAELRHYRPTINRRWGQDVAIAAGDYLYAEAFRLIAECGNFDLIGCISTATKLMCEGELQQVCERDNFDLLKQQYFIMVKKKTGALFAASCQAGTMLANPNPLIQNSLKEYGLNLGIAFQIRDDCQDLIGKKEEMGKIPGTDLNMGELTLPVLNLLCESRDKKQTISLISNQDKQEVFKEIRQRFINSEAFIKTKMKTQYYIQKAKRSINRLRESPFKESLFVLADHIM